jgi:hypothetical protein
MYRNLKAVRSIAVFHSRNMPPNSALYPRLFFLAALGGSAKKTLRGIASDGRYLVRLSDSLFLAPQSDLEKNQNAVRKGLARNAQIRGVFGSPP